MKKLRLAVLLLVVGPAVHAQLVWNFGITSGSASPSSSAIGNLTASVVSRYNNNGNTASFTSTSVSSGYSGASGSFNAAASAIPGGLNVTTSTRFEFTLTPASGYTVTLTNISFGTRSTFTGPTNIAVQSSANNFASNLATGISTDSWTLFSSPTFSGVIGTDVDPLMLRIYAYGGNGSAGTINWRIDDLSLNLSMTAVPEPSTYATIVGALALVAAGLKRRGQKRSSS